MTDEQLVLAIIQSYKSRGVDMSYILDDPLFCKLHPASKVAAVKAHAAELYAGSSPSMSRSDVRNIGYNAALAGVQGALAGGTVGAGLAALSPNGLTRTSGAVAGALMMGLIGAGVGGFQAMSGVSSRKAFHEQAGILKDSPTDANAVGTISSGYLSGGDIHNRSRILDRVSTLITEHSKTNLDPFLRNQHDVMVGIHGDKQNLEALLKLQSNS